MTGRIIAPAPAEQRIDKWLWCARFCKTRSLAAKIAEGGVLRLTRGGATTRIDKPSQLVRAGDRVAFLEGGRVRIIEIIACAVRRGRAAEAKRLYVECGGSEPAEAAPLKCVSGE